MTVAQYLTLAEDTRRAARRERFANGETPLYLSLIGLAGAADRAAADLARHENTKRWGESLATYQKGA